MKKPTVFRRIAATVAALALTLGVTAACGGDDDKEITIGYIGWDEAVAASNMWKLILEDEGYKVELKELEAGLIYQGLANGDVDFFLDSWLPATHKQYMDKFGDKVVKLGQWYEGSATLNVTVPSYVEDVNSMEDLAANADTFGGEIIGIEDSAGITSTAKDSMIPEYGLDGKMDLKTSSTSAMLTELDSAIANEEPIVVTLWHPHWAYAKYDLKDLEDPKGAMGEGETVQTIASQDFNDDHKDLVDMLNKFKMDDQTLGDLEDYVLNQHKDDPEAGAEAWLKDNPDFAKGLK